MTITVGIDSFVSMQEADLYMENRLYTDAWPFLETDPRLHGSSDHWSEPEENATRLKNKERALRLATQTLNNQRYIGRLVDHNQPLARPRIGARDHEGRPLDPELIPANIKAATCELALAIMRDDLTDEKHRRYVYRLKADRVGESSATYSQRAGVELPVSVLDCLALCLESQSSLLVRP